MAVDTSISRSVLNIDVCIADLGYEIVLKKNRGYKVLDLENRLALMVNLRKMLSWTSKTKKYNTETGKIENCGNNIVPNPSNPVLNTTDSGCVTIQEDCCITLKMICDKMKTICKYC